jgi:hypothetical protein
VRLLAFRFYAFGANFGLSAANFLGLDIDGKFSFSCDI